MSSHREAPEISKDPVADSTDLYAFVSPDKPDTVTLIANYIPLQDPAGGPNFYEFGDDVLYEIHIDNDGDGGRRHATSSGSRPSPQPRHVPLQHRPDPSLDDAELEPPADLHGHRGSTAGKRRRCSAARLPVPAVQHRPAVDAELRRLATRPSTTSATGEKVFAGQRAEGFYVDLGSIFDLGTLRPFQNLHLAAQLPAGDPGQATAQDSTCTPSRSRCRSADLTKDGCRPAPTPADPKRHDRRVDHGQPAAGPSSGDE